jgi:hypothetical protein
MRVNRQPPRQHLRRPALPLHAPSSRRPVAAPRCQAQQQTGTFDFSKFQNKTSLQEAARRFTAGEHPRATGGHLMPLRPVSCAACRPPGGASWQRLPPRPLAARWSPR